MLGEFQYCRQRKRTGRKGRGVIYAERTGGERGGSLLGVD